MFDSLPAVEPLSHCKQTMLEVTLNQTEITSLKCSQISYFGPHLLK